MRGRAKAKRWVQEGEIKVLESIFGSGFSRMLKPAPASVTNFWMLRLWLPKNIQYCTSFDFGPLIEIYEYKISKPHSLWAKAVRSFGNYLKFNMLFLNSLGRGFVVRWVIKSSLNFQEFSVLFKMLKSRGYQTGAYIQWEEHCDLWTPIGMSRKIYISKHKAEVHEIYFLYLCSCIFTLFFSCTIFFPAWSISILYLLNINSLSFWYKFKFLVFTISLLTPKKSKYTPGI